MPGGGRPKGALNKGRAEFLKIIHDVGKPKELIATLKELTQGVLVEKKVGELRAVYKTPPSEYAITYLLDQAYGKAKQSVEVEGKLDVSWEDMFGIGGVNPESED